MSYGNSPETLDYIDYLEAENERLIDENIRLKELGEQWIEVIDGQEHMVKAVDKEE